MSSVVLSEYRHEQSASMRWSPWGLDPWTAKGFVFLCLEDKTGIANIIFAPNALDQAVTDALKTFTSEPAPQGFARSTFLVLSSDHEFRAVS